ncbi:MAG: hypothetical protein LBN93_09585 [Candidatus Symbiothrix sp.]|nr:hypothetical protein [Candidatus Symbiothrix sp.]
MKLKLNTLSYRRLRLLTIAVAIFCTALAGVQTVQAEDPPTTYLIYTWEDLAKIAENPSASYLLMNDLSALTSDYGDYFDVSTGWTPISSFTGTLDGGDNHIISGLWINNATGSYLGLFASADGATFKNLNIVLGEDGITGRDNIGILVGSASGSIEIDNVHVTGKITKSTAESDQSWNIGGMIGGWVNVAGNASRIWNNSTANFTFETDLPSDYVFGGYIFHGVGGLIGHIGGVVDSETGANIITISTVNVTAAIHTTGGFALGGLIGHIGGVEADIENVEADVDIEGYGSLGGLIGAETGVYDNPDMYAADVRITNSVSRGSVTGTWRFSDDLHRPTGIGGMVGSVLGTDYEDYDNFGGFATPSLHIDGSHSDVNVTGKGSSENDDDIYRLFGDVGGLVGSFSGYYPKESLYDDPDYFRSLEFKIENSYATGDVSGDINVGGLVGSLCGGVNDADNGVYPVVLLENSYATGNVLGSVFVGGLVGKAYLVDTWIMSGADIVNCFATGTVTGSGYVGGFIGAGQLRTLTGNFSMGKVTGIPLLESEELYWHNIWTEDPYIKDLDTYEEVESETMDIGGFVGFLIGASYDGDGDPLPVVFADNYARGNVQIAASSSFNVGGFVGELNLADNYEAAVFATYGEPAPTQFASLERSYYSGKVIIDNATTDEGIKWIWEVNEEDVDIFIPVETPSFGAFIGYLAAAPAADGLVKLYYDVTKNSGLDPVGSDDTYLVADFGRSTLVMTGTVAGDDTQDETAFIENLAADNSVANSAFKHRNPDALEHLKYYPELKAFESAAAFDNSTNENEQAASPEDVQYWSLKSVIEASDLRNEWKITSWENGIGGITYTVDDLIANDVIGDNMTLLQLNNLINGAFDANPPLKDANDVETNILRLVFGDGNRAVETDDVLLIKITESDKQIDIEGWLTNTSGGAFEFDEDNLAVINFNAANQANTTNLNESPLTGYTHVIPVGNGGRIESTTDVAVLA